MIKHTQSKLHLKDENGNVIQHGNCYATTIACLLDLPINMVPNIETLYIIETGRLYQDVLDAWLKEKGYKLTYAPNFGLYHDTYKDDIDWMSEEEKEKFKEDNKEELYLISSETVRGTRHICIYQNGELYWDVHPSRAGVIKIEFYEATIEILEKI